MMSTETSNKKPNRATAWLVIVGLVLFMCALVYIVGRGGGAPAAPAEGPVLVTLVCADCAAAGIDINLWETPARTRAAGSVAPNSAATVLETTTHEGRLFYRVRSGGITGWLPEDFIQK